MNAVQCDRKERRVHPRFNASFPVTLMINSGGEKHTIDTQANNISLNTIQVEGDSDIMSLFQSQNEYPNVCTLRFTLPQEAKAIEVECHKVTHRRLSQNSYYMALSFVRFIGNGETRFKEVLVEMKEAGMGNFMGPAQQVQELLSAQSART